MTRACRTLPANSDVRKLCTFLTVKKRIPVNRIDAGVPYIDFRKVKPFSKTLIPKRSIVAGTKGNRRLESGEIYERMLHILEGENTYKRNVRHGRTSVTRFVKGLKCFRPPWMLTDFDPRTTADAVIARKVRRGVDAIKAVVKRTGVRPGTKAYNLKLVHALVNWIVRPKAKGGLGIKPQFISSSQVKQERTALQILASSNRKSHCSELNYLLYEIFRIAGLKSEFLLVYDPFTYDHDLAHVCVGVRLDPRRPTVITAIDLTEPIRSTWIGTPHDVVISIPRKMMMGMYFNNKASTKFNHGGRLKLARGMKRLIKANLDRALHFDRTFPLFHYNAAVYSWGAQRNKTLARRYVNEALRLFPVYRNPALLKRTLNK